MTTTRVVNLKTDPYDVYIGRAGKGHDGYYGNPYPVGFICSRCKQRHDVKEATLPCFTAYFTHRLATDAEYRARVLTLRGKVLGCFCAPGPCHGDVLAAFLNRPRAVIDAELDRLTATRR